MGPLDTSILLVMCIFFFSTFVRSTFGFGDALVAMPLLAIILDLKIAAPLFALIGCTISIIILFKNWRDIHFESAWRLIVSSIVGVPIGVLILKGMHDVVLKLSLAIIIMGFSAHKLATPKQLHLKTERSSFVFGFLAGVFGGAYNVCGPPVAIYGSLRRWPPATFRANLQGFFLVIGFLILWGHYVGGLVTPNVLQMYAITLPAVIVATILGAWLHQKIAPGKFERYIHVLLVIIGAYLFFNIVRRLI
jgi:uncharacterized membrane protein YfcA